MNNKNLKIAFFLPTLNIGGIERVFITYANYLTEKEYDIDFVLCKKEGKLLSLLNSSIKLYDLGNMQLRYSFFKLRQYMKKIQPNVIISGGDFPNLILIIHKGLYPNFSHFIRCPSSSIFLEIHLSV